MTEKYKNPSLVMTQSIIDSLKNAETHDEAMKIITDVFPTWIVGYSSSYSRDYPSLTENWKLICSNLKCDALSIIIVDEFVENNDEHSLIQIFSELLTLFGHRIHKKSDFFKCKICNGMLPSNEIYNELKKSNAKVPSVWRKICKDC